MIASLHFQFILAYIRIQEFNKLLTDSHQMHQLHPSEYFIFEVKGYW